MTLAQLRVTQDGVIQKDEFMQALFNTTPGQLNLFADRVRAGPAFRSWLLDRWPPGQRIAA